MLKHSIVRTVSAFSFTVLTLIIIGALAPKVCAETVPGSGTVLSDFGENEQDMQLKMLLEEVEKKRDFRDMLVRRLGDLQQEMPALKDSLRALDTEIECLAAEVAELRKEAEYSDRMRSIAAIDAWCDAHGKVYEAVECASFGVSESFLWPVPGYSVITCGFGGGHRGIDISGYDINGKPIAAAKGGCVTHSGWLDSYGYSVFIDHGDGFSTRYAHASELFCAAGDTVLPGQTVAYVGSTGYSTGPHLHFEVLRDGVLLDPFDFY